MMGNSKCVYLVFEKVGKDFNAHENVVCVCEDRNSAYNKVREYQNKYKAKKKLYEEAFGGRLPKNLGKDVKLSDFLDGANHTVYFFKEYNVIG